MIKSNYKEMIQYKENKKEKTNFNSLMYYNLSVLMTNSSKNET